MNDDKTPVEPAIRRSSQNRLALEDCPCCALRGQAEGGDGYSATCELCGGGRKVAPDTAEQWRLEHEMPDTEPGT